MPQPTAVWQIALMPWGRLCFCSLTYISLLPLSTLCLQPLDMLISISLLRLSSTVFLPGEEFPLLTPTALQLLGVPRCAISYPRETAVSFSLAYLSPRDSPTRLWDFKAKDNVLFITYSVIPTNITWKYELFLGSSSRSAFCISKWVFIVMIFHFFGLIAACSPKVSLLKL